MSGTRAVLVGLLAVVVVALLAGVAWLMLANPRSGPTPQWLFAQSAGSASLEVADDGSVRLVLRDVDPHTLAFTDRPARQASTSTVERLVAEWDTAFGADPPNAAVVDHGDPSGLLAMTLADPKLTGSTLSFAATPIDGSGRDWSAAAFASKGTVSVFIDDAATPPGGNVMFGSTWEPVTVSPDGCVAVNGSTGSCGSGSEGQDTVPGM